MQPEKTNTAFRNALLICVVAIVLVVSIGILAPATPKTEQKTTSKYTFPFGQTIELQITPKKMAELERRRAEALRIGILRDDDSSWVKAKLIEGEDTMPVRVRLKGDWVDHLEGEKWSFRVEMKDSMAWRRMHEFSLLSAERRGFLNEWLFHQVLMQEGVLSPRYDFIHLKLNGRLLGTYAVEEHFCKELLESQHRREGPILKIDESGMWDARVAALRDSAFPYLQIPFFEAAPVRPFDKKHILKDSMLHAQLDNALRLLEQYRVGNSLIYKPSSDDTLIYITNGTVVPKLYQVFDIQLAAKQYALTDLFAAYHSLIWHNRRYYFNPFTQKLEPIVFDGFSGPVNDTYIPYPFWGYQLHGHGYDDASYRESTSVHIFQDPDFVREYYHQLERYCEPGFMDSVLVAMRPALKQREQLLRDEYGGYRFEENVILENAAKIRAILAHDLREELFDLQNSQDLYCYPTCVYIRNGNALPVEFWSETQTPADAQFLEANDGQPRQAQAYFSLKPGQKIYYRLPGSRVQHVLDWEE